MRAQAQPQPNWPRSSTDDNLGVVGRREGDTVRNLLGVVADLLGGQRHSRRSIAKATGKSLPTADRWLDDIEDVLPNVRRRRDGRAVWISYEARRSAPTKPAVVGACVAA